MPILDITALLAPIPGDDPGGPHPSKVRDKDRDPTNLERIRRESKERKGDSPPIESLPMNDPARVKHWRDGMKLAQELFATKSKNLDWAIFAADTAARSGGIAGAREGFQFLTKVVTDCWDWIWPRPNLAAVESADPDDRESVRRDEEANCIETRAGRFQSLDDPGSGLLFPNVIRECVLAEQEGMLVSVLACRGAEGRPAKMTMDQVQSVARKIGPERVRETLAEIEGSLTDLDALRQAVEQRFIAANAEDQAPSFREVRLALEDCRRVADEMLAAVGGDAPPPTEADAGSAPAGEKPATPKDKLSRASLYKQLAEIADHLTRLEPHSPVPFLLQRIIELQDLPFPRLVRELTKSSESVLTFMERSIPASPTEE